MSELTVDGDKYNRLDDTGCTNEDNYAWEGSNILARGSNYTIHHIDTINAQCGSGLELVGNDIHVYSVYAASNGFSVDEATKWADGITVLRCTSGYIHNNWVYENTDVGIAIFGGTDCAIRWNDIANFERYAFAGMTLNDNGNDNGWYNGQIGSNWITSGYEKMSTGLYIGGHPSPYSIIDMGDVVNNRIEGAVVNVWIEGVESGWFHDNWMLNPQGTRHNLCLGTSGNYLVNDFGLATIQGGWTVFSVHSCS